LIPDDIATLEAKIVNNSEIEKITDAILLKSTNHEVNSYNSSKYAELTGEKYTYNCSCKGNKDLLQDLKKQFSAKGIDTLKLKEGCRVMLVRNIDVDLGLVNGATGYVVGFVRNCPIVRFDHRQHAPMTIAQQEWKREIGYDHCTVTQIPLVLSWANTIHKVQGLSLSKAVIDVGRAFCNHQVYVALSRVKSLDG